MSRGVKLEPAACRCGARITLKRICDVAVCRACDRKNRRRVLELAAALRDVDDDLADLLCRVSGLWKEAP